MRHNFTTYLIVIFLLVFLSAYSFTQANQHSAGEKVGIRFPFGESTGSYSKFPSALTENEWRALKTQTLNTQEGRTDLKQYLRFQGEGISGCTQVFTEDERGNTGNFLKCDSDEVIWEAQLEFTRGLESRISDGKLVDIEGLKFDMLGRSYAIVNSKINTDANTIELRLVGGAPAGGKFLLREGQTSAVGGFPISPIIISNNGKVVFLIGGRDGERTKPIEENEAIILSDGSAIGVTKVLLNEAGEEEAGEDMVEFYYSGGRNGGGSMIMSDTYTDNNFKQGSRIGGSTSTNLLVRINGNKLASNKFRIKNIFFRLRAAGNYGGDVLIPVGQTLAQNHREPIAADLIPIAYGGVSSQQSRTLRQQTRTAPGSIVAIQRRGSDQYDMSFMNTRGQAYNFPLFGPGLSFGDDEGSSLIFDESSSNTDFIVEKGDYVVLTDKNTKTGTTSILRFRDVDATNNIVYFEDLAMGKKTVVLQPTEIAGALGEGYLISGGDSFAIVVKEDGSALAIDTTGDRQFNDDEADIVIFGGGRFELGNPLTLITDESLFDDATSDEELDIDFSSSSGSLNVDVNTQSGVIDMNDVGSGGVTLSIPGVSISEGDDVGMSNFGVLVAVVDNNEDLFLSYPLGGSRSFSGYVSTSPSSQGQAAGIMYVG